MSQNAASPRRARLPLAAALFLLFVAAASAPAQQDSVLIPYLGAGYRYQQVSWGGLTGFQAPGFNDSAWPTGNAGFGTISATCPLNDTANVKTPWSSSTDILIRKHFSLPGGAVRLKVSVAIDNDVQVFINGADISGGLRTHEGCATRNSFVFTAPDSVLASGDNVIAVRGRDRGVQTYLDVRVTAVFPLVIPVTSAADDGPGTLRAAINASNTNPAADTITFALPGGGAQTISVLTALPGLTDRATIDGTTQQGYAGVPLITLSGPSNPAFSPAGMNGLTILGGNTTVRGLIINRFSGHGIAIRLKGGNVVAGSYIGTDGAGVPTAPPIGGSGIAIDSSSDNRIGGTAAADRNIIAGNTLAGVAILTGRRNAVLGNAIFANGGLGIDLGGDGVTPNHQAGGGSTDLQNFPVLTFAAYDLQGIAGVIDGLGQSDYRIEFFRNPTADPSGYGEGTTLIGVTPVHTDSTGHGTFFAEFPGELPAGAYIAATATGPDSTTSEFSPATLITARIQTFGSHYVTNTTLSGIPLHWPDGNGMFSISTTVPDQFRQAITDGFAAWSALPQVEYAPLGVTTNTVWGGSPDGVNNAVWITNGWGDLTGADSNVVAVTRVRYNTLNGLITDADIAYDAQHFDWSAAPVETPVMDVQNVTTHEAGHYSGLGDIYNPGDPGYVPAMASGNQDVTMYGLIVPGETSKRSLETPDTSAISYIYATVPASRVDLMLVFDGSAGFATTQGAFLPSKNSTLELVQKLRTGDRFGVVRLPSTVVFPLTEIVDSTTRAQASAALNTLVAGGASAIGSGLQAAQSQLGIAPVPNRKKAMILFSAGEEDALPSALTVLPPIAAAGTSIFTFGFPGSSGQTLANTIADSTGGAYYQAADSTIHLIVNQIWNTLTGQQFSFLTIAQSDTFQNVPFPGISWQGPVDKGTTRSQPGISWQGPKTGTLVAKGGLPPQAGSYVLSLLPPGGNTLIDSAYVADHPELGISFTSGPTFQFYTINSPVPGIWTLYTFARQLPAETEPVVVSIASITDVTMAVGFDQIQYTPGEPISMRVELSEGGQATADRHVTGGNPIIDATVLARVARPGTDSTTEVPFTHLGAGVYTASFAGTNTPGTYGVTFIARRDTVERIATEAVYVVPPPSPGGNVLANPGFESGKTPWSFYTNGSGSYTLVAPGATGASAAKLTVTQPATNTQFTQAGMNLDPNAQYRLTFKAYSNNGRNLAVYVHRNTAPYTNYGLGPQVFDLTTSWQTFSVTFTTKNFPPPTPTDARLRFQLSGYAVAGTVYYIDDVVLERTNGGPPAPAAIRVETTPEGSGSIVPAQTLQTGQSLTMFAVARDQGGAYLGNVAAVWSLSDVTGGIVAGDLVAAPDGKSAIFTPSAAGTARITASSGSTPTVPSGLITAIVPPTPTNVIVNGGFESGTTAWSFFTNGTGFFKTISPGSVGTRAGQIGITVQGTSVQLFQYGIPLTAGQPYRLSFKALCNTGHDLQVSILKHTSPYTTYGLPLTTFNLGNTWATYSVDFIASGFTGSVNDARLRFWLSPYDAFGDLYLFDDVRLEPLGASPDAGAPSAAGQVMPSEFSLGPNFPNPFNPATTITYALPVDAHVSLQVYSLLGQKVADLVDGMVTAGRHDVQFDGTNLASGLYIIRLAARPAEGTPFTQTGKMILTK
jgi:hypothetical protein